VASFSEIFRVFNTISRELPGYTLELHHGSFISLPYQFIRRHISTGDYCVRVKSDPPFYDD